MRPMKPATRQGKLRRGCAWSSRSSANADTDAAKVKLKIVSGRYNVLKIKAGSKAASQSQWRENADSCRNAHSATYAPNAQSNQVINGEANGALITWSGNPQPAIIRTRQARPTAKAPSRQERRPNRWRASSRIG